jgi:hypothetical protein
MRNGFRIFDTHTHLGAARHSGRFHSEEHLLTAMDRAGVDRALAFPFPVVEDYRAMHDEVARAVRRHPDRLAGAASFHPFLPPGEFEEEVRRCAEELGFVGLKLQPQYQPLNPISERSDFYFAAAVRHRLPVICHTGTGAPFALPSLFIMPARKFPELRLVLAHCGGAIYYAEAIVAAACCPNVYLELSSLMPHHVREVLGYVASDRLMIGSDLPESVECEIGKIVNLEVDDKTRSDILWNTARRVFDRG